MENAELWVQIKNIFINMVQYGFPTLAIILSLLSYKDSKKANKMQVRLNLIEEKLMSYDLEEKEKKREEATKACIEARIMKISNNNYKLKIWNSGEATAYNVNFQTTDEIMNEFIQKDKVPFEMLDSHKSFEECVLIHIASPRKFPIITTWEDEEKKQYSKNQIVSY